MKRELRGRASVKFIFNNPALKPRRRGLRKTQTDAERVFWARVRNRQLHGMRFLRQYSIGSYIPDFYCPDRKVAVELDGGQHNEPEVKMYDASRSEYLRTHGVEVLRFWDHEVLVDIEAVLIKLVEKVTSHGLSLTKTERKDSPS